MRQRLIYVLVALLLGGAIFFYRVSHARAAPSMVSCTLGSYCTLGASTPSSSSSNGSLGVEHGTKFTSSTSGQITHMAFYRAAVTASETVVALNLWDTTATSSPVVHMNDLSGCDDGSVGWKTCTLPTPYTVVANRAYVVSLTITNGTYAYGNSVAPNNPPLSVDGVVGGDTHGTRWFTTGSSEGSPHYPSTSSIDGSGATDIVYVDTFPTSTPTSGPTATATPTSTVTPTPTPSATTTATPAPSGVPSCTFGPSSLTVDGTSIAEVTIPLSGSNLDNRLLPDNTEPSGEIVSAGAPGLSAAGACVLSQNVQTATIGVGVTGTYAQTFSGSYSGSGYQGINFNPAIGSSGSSRITFTQHALTFQTGAGSGSFGVRFPWNVHGLVGHGYFVGEGWTCYAATPADTVYFPNDWQCDTTAIYQSNTPTPGPTSTSAPTSTPAPTGTGTPTPGRCLGTVADPCYVIAPTTESLLGVIATAIHTNPFISTPGPTPTGESFTGGAALGTAWAGAQGTIEAHFPVATQAQGMLGSAQAAFTDESVTCDTWVGFSWSVPANAPGVFWQTIAGTTIVYVDWQQFAPYWCPVWRQRLADLWLWVLGIDAFLLVIQLVREHGK